MTKACFQSMSLAGVRGAENALGHCERKYTGRGKEPDYLLPIEHREPNITEVFITPKEVMAKIKKNGKLHHSAKPFREAVILLNEDTTDQQIEECIEQLCEKLEVHKMYVSIHNDEGHINGQGEVIRNRHLHFGYTNYRAKDHKMVHIDKTKMRVAQDICAQALGMSRGESKETTAKQHIGHKTWRMMKREQSVLDKQVKEIIRTRAKTATAWMTGITESNQDLIAANKSLQEELDELREQAIQQARELNDEKSRHEEQYRSMRKELMASGAAQQSDYQRLKKEKDEELERLKAKIKQLQQDQAEQEAKSHRKPALNALDELVEAAKKIEPSQDKPKGSGRSR